MGFHENEIFQVQKIMTTISHDPELLTSYELIATPNNVTSVKSNY